MQNVVNLHCPFLFHGEPIVNGRVYFVKEDTAATTYNSVAGLDNAFFVPVYDKDGHALPNPLSLDSEGVFSVQPFVDEDTDYKMIVCRQTGVSPELNDETQAWEVAYTIDSKTMHVTVDYQGIAKVGSIAELRQLDKGVGSVLVTGYNEANDFCPPRIFTWKTQNLTDNGGSHIRSTKEGQTSGGTWVCEPQGYVDVRWFGVEPGVFASTDDCWAVVNNIVSTYYPDLPVYFPKGYYRLSDNLTVNSAMILDNGAYIRPHSRSITLTINRLENRGGKFHRSRLDSESNYYNVYPKIKGELRTSWMNSPAEMITDEMLANVTVLVVDSNVAFDSEYTISKKRVLVKDGVGITNVVFDKCEVFYETDGRLETKELKSENIDFYGLAEILAETPSAGVHGLTMMLKENGDLSNILKLLINGSEIFSGLKMPWLKVGEVEAGLQNGWYDGGDDSLWPGILALYANAASLKNILAESLAVHGTMSHAKSGRSKVLLTVYQYDELNVAMNVKKDGVEWTNIFPSPGMIFSLYNVIKDDEHLFAGARDFDILVVTTIACTVENDKQISIVLPSDYADEEKIFSVCYAPIMDTLGRNSPLKLLKAVAGTPPTTEEVKYEGQDSQYETASQTYDNSFVGTRVVRKESNGDWFFDPFTI